jgi:diketogulonate reductase-like aldo/keto reductase
MASPASSPIPTVTLHTVDNGNKKRMEMPILGLGTYKFKKDSGEAKRAVLDALSVGIRHIDTAFIYGGERTEREIGEALLECTNVPREEIFLTSKQWRAYHGYELTKKCLDLSLKRLQTPYLDLWLIHWPGPAYSTMSRSNEVMQNSPEGPFVYAKDGHSEVDMVALRAETYRAMEDAVYEGKCRAIGVSNFTVKHLEALRKTARIWPPAVNQIELHPYNPQTDIVEYCQKHSIVIEAYASLGGQDSGKKTWNKLGGKLADREEIRNIAEKHGKTPSQILLRWATQQGFAVIPKTGNANHMRENVAAVVKDGWKSGDLDADDMKQIAALDQYETAEDKARLCWVRDPLRHLNFE